jgi:hypothetical protein
MAAKKSVKPRRAARRSGGRSPRRRQRAATAGAVLVVNMIPRSLSRETNQDSEPSISVNPAHPLEIVGTAFTPDPMGGPLAPIYVSADGGNTWRLNSIVPSAAGSSTGTSDISLAFATAGGRLYGGILRDPSTDFETLRATAAANPMTMQTLASRPDNDQPFTHAITRSGRDRVYIGNNDFQASPSTATLDVSLNARKTHPAFRSIRLEPRATVGQDGPQIRPVAHVDGTVYATYYGWRAESGSFPGNTLVVTTDVVVVRDDHGGSGTAPFRHLVDPGDGLPGRLVARNARIPFNRNGSAATGQQRLGGTLSLAVDPRPAHSGTVYLAWADQPPQIMLMLHIRCSTDRGVTWSAADLLTVPNATNAALAINSAGAIGLLYQQLSGSGANRRWVTHFRRSSDGANWDDFVLATTPANLPAKTFDPYLGDYDHLVAVGADFYGIFSANNTPNAANFPNGVTYQRNADFASQTLLALDNTTPVAPSIDPFFFKVKG